MGRLYIFRSKNVVHSLLRIINVTLLLFFIFLLSSDHVQMNDVLSMMVITATITGVLMVFMNPTIYNSGILMMAYAYMLITHNGFVIAYFFDNNYINFKSESSMAFVKSASYPVAIIIANIIMLFFALFMEVQNRHFYYLSYGYNDIDIKDNSYDGDILVNIITIPIMMISMMILIFVVVRYSLWAGRYSNIIAITKNLTILHHSIIWMSLSIAMLFAAGTRKGIFIGITIFGITSIFHFSIGNRGEVLYTAVICFALYSLRYKSIKRKQVFIAFIALILLIPFVRILRSGGMETYSFSLLNSFSDLLCEIGIQVSPFTSIVEYIQSGHSHVWGMTYINDFLDFILRRFGGSSPYMNTTEYVIKSIMPKQGLGFSIIAELFYNFGIVGAVIFFAFYSHFLKKIDYNFFYNKISINQRLFYSMLMVELINLTRNDASTLPVNLVYILIFLLLYILLRNFARKINSNKK